jgi:uncharacterized membrane protein
MIDITHIHPMLVHFPLVLLPIGTALYAAAAFRGEDLAVRRCLPVLALLCLGAGVMMAMIAAAFGDMALDAALDKGFDKGPLEEHEDLAGPTIVVFAVLVAIQALAMWRSISLKRGRAWLLTLVALAGVALLLATAYHGGELVYQIGVNVVPVKP